MRLVRKLLACALAVVLAMPTTGVALANESNFAGGGDSQSSADVGAGQAAEPRAVEEFTFGVMSDPHYFPAEYQGTRAEAYQNQISGDLRLMGENEALTTAAVDQMLADAESGERALPKVLLVTGDLTSEGEKAGHEGFAAQMKRLQEAGVTVLVIPGNHDLYNYDAMTFKDDNQTKDGGSGSLWTTEADFRSIYASMGYDEQATVAASNGTIESIDYFKSVEADGVADCQGGLSYVARTNAGVAFIMIDSEVYTPDWNGQGKDWGQGAGMMSNELLEWVKDQAAQLAADGYSIVAGIHHPVLEHQATAETEFVTDRVDVDNGDGTRSTDNTHYIATQLADAGIHYIFSGHMHENDVASYTTAAGNTIYDMETGGLCAYPSPYRYANLSAQDDEMSLDLWSVSVEQAAMNQRLDAPNGTLTDTEKVDVKEYERNAMYGDKNADGESFITRLVMRYAARYLDQLVDIPAALQNIAGLDLYDTLFDALPGLLSSGADVDLGDLGAIHISWNDTGEFNTSGVNLDPSGTAGLLSSFTIRNGDIKEEVQSVLDQIEANYIANGRLESEISKLLENVGDVNLLKPDNPNDQSGNCYTLRQLLQDMFQRHNSGADKEPMSANMQQALSNLQTSSILQNKVQDVLDNTLIPLIDEVLRTTTVDVDNLFGRNTLWHTAVQAILGSDNPSIATVLDKFGLDLFGEGGLVTGLLNQYLTASVYQQIGGLVVAMVTGFAGDADTLDDVVDGAAVKLNATMDPEPNPTVENGALPDQVSMSLDSDNTATSRAFSWYTSTEVDGSDVQMIPASAASSVEDAQTVMDAGSGVTEEVASDVKEVNKAKITLNLVLVTDYEIVQMNHHTATAAVPAGDFYYRVGDAEQGYWSDPVYVDGEGDPSDGYTALVVADSQGSSEADYEAYEAVLSEAEEKTADEAFALHLGDMVDDGVNENYWSWLMDTDASEAVATMPVAGNHEARQDDAQLANAIVAHYNVDIPDQDTSTGVYYSFVYGDATYIVLNTNDGDTAVGDAQRAWAANVADSADTTWKIVVTHKAPYSKGSHQNDSDVVALRSWLSGFATQHGIDLVLSGHDHTYMRTPSLTNGTAASVTTQAVTDSAGNSYEAQVNPAGTTFVVPSTSGTKFYDIEENDLPTEKSGQPYLPIYSTLSIEGDTLFWRSYTYDAASGASTLYDSFAIKKDDNLTAAEKVMQMIDALPAPDTVNSRKAADAAQPAVAEARAAYEALTDGEKAQVSNIAKLEQLEKLIETYQDLATGVCDLSDESLYPDEDARRAGFIAAMDDSDIGTIIFPSDDDTAIGTYSGSTLNGQYYRVTRDLVIKSEDGSPADVRRLGFYVDDGATLVLENIQLRSWENKGGVFTGNKTPMNLVWMVDGTFVANGATSLQVMNDDEDASKYNDTANRGHAIVIGLDEDDRVENGGTRTVYLNTTGELKGLRETIYQAEGWGSTDDRIYFNGGTYASWNGNANFNVNCQVEVDDGTFNQTYTKQSLTINGGTFGDGTRIPIMMENGGDLYVKNAEALTPTSGGKLFQLSEGSELHIANAALEKLSGTSLAISAGNPTADGFPVSAEATGLGEDQDGTIFAVGQQITSMQGMAANDQGGLETTVEGRHLSATARLAADQVAYAYAKYHAASNSALAGYVNGATDGLYAYSGYQLLSNEISSIGLSCNPGPIVCQTDGAWPNVQMTASIAPSDATQLVEWKSSDDTVATVDKNGMVTFNKAGQVTVTATHATTGASAEMTLYAVEPVLEGSDAYSADATEGQPYQLKLGMGTVNLVELPDGYTVAWSLSSDAQATVEPSAGNQLRALLERTGNEASELTVTATLVKDGTPTGISASKTVSIEWMAPEPTFADLEGLVKVSLTDANESVAHGKKTFDLLENTEGQNDSYTVTSLCRVDAPADNPVESLAELVGLSNPEKIWKANVTVHAAPYIAEYDEQLDVDGLEHQLVSGDSGDRQLTLRYDGSSASWKLDEGSASPVEFTVACTMHKVSFKFVGAPEGVETPEPVAVLDQAQIGDELPAVEDREGYEFGGWYADGECTRPVSADSPLMVTDDVTLYGKWTSTEPGPVPTPEEPNAPTAEDIAGPDSDVFEGVISATLHDVNDLNGTSAGGSHADVTYETGTASEHSLPAEALSVGGVEKTDDAWTVAVTLDASELLDDYNAEFGEHYFASPEEDGKREIRLVWDAEKNVWQLASDDAGSESFEITCLTLRPAKVEKYVGGESQTGGHFADQYVIDGQGNAYAIDDLNVLLDGGATAVVKYYDQDGNEFTDDKKPGRYTARIVVEAAGDGGRSNGEGAEDTVEVTVNGSTYAFALEPSELVIRDVSDADAAEDGNLNVPLVNANDSNAIKEALETEGGVVAALPDGTTIWFNGNVDVPLEDISEVTLFSDDLLPGQREQELIDHANQQLGAGTVDQHYDFQYLDLVDKGESNAWVSSSKGTTVFWKIPDGANADSVRIYHFAGLHRDYSATGEEVSSLIAESTVEKVELDTSTAGDGYVSFTVPASGFSPYVMTWDEGATPPVQQFTVTFDAQGGTIDGDHAGSETVTAGGTLASLPTATRAGYTFKGWFTEGGAEFTTSTPVTGDITVYAEWTQDEPDPEPTPDPEPDPDPEPTPEPTPEPEPTPNPGPAPTPQPSIEVPSSEGGQTTVADVHVKPGETASVSTSPEEGWLVDRITVTDADGDTVHVHYVGPNSYEFAMPEGGATVDVKYRKVQSMPPFADVAAGSWYEGTVDLVSSYGFMTGYGADVFGPDDVLDRAMMACVIYNLAGRPSVDEGVENTFADCGTEEWYSDALAWCEAEGVVTGYGDGVTYGPFDPVTREQLAAMLWRLSGEPAAAGESLASFPDAGDTSAFAVAAMRWATEVGVMHGNASDGLMHPADDATRAEVATMVMNWWFNVATAQ